MKILVISDYRNYHSVRPEAELFIGLSRMGFDIHIMTYGTASYVDEFVAAGIKVIDFHPEKKFNKTEIKRIREQLIRGNYDILHLFNSPAIINGIQASRGLPVKVVLYRGFAGHIHWYEPTSYLKFLHPRVDKIMCNSIGVEEYLRRQLICRKDKAITINKGHKLEWYQDIKPIDIKKETGIPHNAFLMINVANNRKMKGIPYLLKAMDMLPPEYPIHLLLIGHNMDASENMTIIGKSPNRNKFHILGFRTDSLGIVAAADAFVLPSIYGESITKSVIEAMALGTAPIITDIRGNVELVVHNECGLVVPSKNSRALSEAILRLYHDRELCRKFSEKARERIATQLNNRTSVEKLKQLYEDLAG